MHSENVRVLKTCRAVLVADFGAFERAKLSIKERREETLSLLGLQDPVVRHICLRENLLPDIVSRVLIGTPTVRKRARIAAEAIMELGLEDEVPHLMRALSELQKGRKRTFSLPSEIERRVLQVVDVVQEERDEQLDWSL